MTVTRKQKKRVINHRRVRWFKLKDQELKAQFKTRVMDEIDSDIKDRDAYWNTLSRVTL